MTTGRIELPRLDDLHVHLRQEAMTRLVAPLTWSGGAGRVLVMPNTVPPIADTGAAAAYRKALKEIEPRLDYLMALYLTGDLTPDEVRRAADGGTVVGVKSYPRGVTTNSEAGVESYEPFHPVFEAMQEAGLVLEIHGETPSDHANDICCLNAESAFLPTVRNLHHAFPRLRIVLEHVTTVDAVEFVKEARESVAATITAHHLELCVDDWAGQNHHFCKPVAKFPRDREALRAVIAEGHPRFFLGSDSAPHPRESKEAAVGCAGVFTAAHLAVHLATVFERCGMLRRLADFSSRFGREFYGLPEANETIVVEKGPTVIPAMHGDVVPFRAGTTLPWRLGP